MSQLTLDLDASVAARERGMSATAIANLRWIATTLEHLEAFARGREEFTMEEFRASCAARGLNAPASHHAWGALASAAAKRHLIRFTGRYVNARSKRTHAHPVKVWRAWS